MSKRKMPKKVVIICCILNAIIIYHCGTRLLYGASAIDYWFGSV